MLISTTVILDPQHLIELEAVMKDKMTATPSELVRFAISFTIACFTPKEEAHGRPAITD